METDIFQALSLPAISLSAWFRKYDYVSFFPLFVNFVIFVV